MRKAKQAQTANNLKNVLWDTLTGVKDGSVSVEKANSIAFQAREITNITKCQLQALKMTGSKLTKTEVKQLLH